MRMSFSTSRALRLTSRFGLSLFAGLALLLGSFVPHASAYRGGGYRGGGIRGGAGFAHARSFGRGSWGGGFGRFHYAPRVRVFAPFHHYYRPHVFFSLGLGFGRPYYYQPAPVVIERDHYIIEDDDNARPLPTRDNRDDGIQDRRSTELDDDFDVTNEPPAGTVYYDGFCDEDFSTLDAYTEHLQNKHHAQTIDIVDRRTGNRLHTLEFLNGEWQPQRSE